MLRTRENLGKGGPAPSQGQQAIPGRLAEVKLLAALPEEPLLKAPTPSTGHPELQSFAFLGKEGFSPITSWRCRASAILSGRGTDTRVLLSVGTCTDP